MESFIARHSIQQRSTEVARVERTVKKTSKKAVDEALEDYRDLPPSQDIEGFVDPTPMPLQMRPNLLMHVIETATGNIPEATDSPVLRMAIEKLEDLAALQRHKEEAGPFWLRTPSAPRLGSQFSPTSYVAQGRHPVLDIDIAAFTRNDTGDTVWLKVEQAGSETGTRMPYRYAPDVALDEPEYTLKLYSHELKAAQDLANYVGPAAIAKGAVAGVERQAAEWYGMTSKRQEIAALVAMGDPHDLAVAKVLAKDVPVPWSTSVRAPEPPAFMENPLWLDFRPRIGLEGQDAASQNQLLDELVEALNWYKRSAAEHKGAWVAEEMD